jgi:hypothetical protein
MMRRTRALQGLISGVLVTAAAVPAQAEVTASGPSGFIVNIELPVAAA